MKLKSLFLLFILSYCGTVLGQLTDDSTLLVLTRKGIKTYLNEGAYLRFHLNPKLAKDCLPCCPEKLDGRYLKRTKDSIWMEVSDWEQIYTDSNGTQYVNYAHYGVFSDNPLPVIKSFSYTDVRTVYYNWPIRRTLNTASQITMGISAVSALIVAPLVSIKKDGGFNGTRYFRIAGWSLAAFGVGLTVNLLTLEKEYKVVVN
jgi:hypothetical protein